MEWQSFKVLKWEILILKDTSTGSCLLTPLIFFFFFSNWELNLLWNTSAIPLYVLLKYWRKKFNINEMAKL